MPESRDELLIAQLRDNLKAARERSTVIYKMLGGFNPLMISLTLGIIIAIVSQKLGAIQHTEIGILLFAAFQFGVLFGAFNQMLIWWLIIDSVYISRVERELSELLSSSRTLEYESWFTGTLLGSGAIAFAALYIITLALLTTISGIAACVLCNSLFVTLAVVLQIIALTSIVIFSFTRGLNRIRTRMKLPSAPDRSDSTPQRVASTVDLHDETKESTQQLLPRLTRQKTD